MAGIERSNVAWNTIAGTVGRIISMALGFVVTPILLGSLGAEAFGVFAILTSLQSYFGILDFGIGGGLSRFMTFHQEKGEDRIAGAITSFGIVFYIIMAAALVPIVILIAPYLITWLGLQGNMANTSLNSIYLVFCLFIFSSISGVLSARIYAAHRMDVTSLISLISNFMYGGAVIVFLPNFPSIYTALYCSFFQLAVTFILSYFAVQKFARFPIANPRHVPIDMLKKLFSFGFWTQINGVTAIINLEADKLVIGRFLGVASVTPYQVANRLALLCRALPLQLLGALFPDVTRSIARGASHREIELIYRHGSRHLMLATLTIVGFLIAVCHAFTTAWIGREIPAAEAIADALMVSYAINNLTGLGTTILRAQGRPKYETVYAVASAALNICFTILLVPKFGLYGVVFGTIIGNVAGSLLFIAIFHHMLRFNYKDNIFRWLLPLLISVVTSGLLTHYINEFFAPKSGDRFLQICIMGLSGIFYLGMLVETLRLCRFWRIDDFSSLQRFGPAIQKYTEYLSFSQNGAPVE